jgi:hypothetical protein
VRRTLVARLAAGTAVAALAVSACGSGDEGGDAGSEASTGGTVVDPPPASAPEDATDGAAPVAGVDLGTEEVDPASDVATNPLPDLVVDDVRRDAKVNLRNLLPAERPVLLCDGEALAGWLGAYPEDEVLELSAPYLFG